MIEPPARFADSFELFFIGVAWLDDVGPDIVDAIYFDDIELFELAMADLGYGVQLIDLAHERFAEEMERRHVSTVAEERYKNKFLDLVWESYDSIELANELIASDLGYRDLAIALEPILDEWIAVH